MHKKIPITFRSLLFLSLWLTAATLVLSCKPANVKSADDENKKANPDAVTPLPVHSDVTIFIMTRCPHCANALKVLLPLQREMNGAMAISVEYIGEVDANGMPDLSLDDPLVAAATAEVCARETTDPQTWLGFMECLYKGDLWKTAATSWEKCAAELSIDTKKVTECLLSSAGGDRLAMSMMSASLEGINAAPTIFIDGRLYFGPLKKEPLLQRICYGNKKTNTLPPICKTVQQPKEIETVLLEDKRCTDPHICDVSRETGFLKALVPDAEFEQVDYSDDKGQDLYKRIVAANGPKTLPIIYFKDTFKDNKAVLKALGRYFIPFEDGVLLPIGQEFDPTQEICGNNIDDDNNGLIDCDDERCALNMECREEQKGRLDLFVMSRCPFASMIAPSVDHFLNHLKKHKSEVLLNLQFIGREQDGELTSMHGDAEIEEDKRMACVQKLYPENNRYFEYVLCRAKDMESDRWLDCLPKFMKKEQVEKCVNGPESIQLLKESFKLAEDTRLQASPSWMLNNRYEINARTAKQILEEFCKKNDLPACSETIAPLLIDSALQSTDQDCN